MKRVLAFAVLLAGGCSAPVPVQAWMLGEFSTRQPGIHNQISISLERFYVREDLTLTSVNSRSNGETAIDLAWCPVSETSYEIADTGVELVASLHEAPSSVTRIEPPDGDAVALLTTHPANPQATETRTLYPGEMCIRWLASHALCNESDPCWEVYPCDDGA